MVNSSEKNSIIKIYKSLGYLSPFVMHFNFFKLYQRFWYEIDKFFAAIIIFISIKLSLTANQISVGSYLLSFIAVL